MFDSNENCQNILLHLWDIEEHWQFSQPIGHLCHIDIVVNEWATNNSILNIAGTVSRIFKIFFTTFVIGLYLNQNRFNLLI